MVLRALTAVVIGLLVFLGTTSLARAAGRDTRAAHAHVHAAPFCDDRGASAYADEPRPVPAHDGAIAPRPDDGCKRLVDADVRGEPVRDDLRRAPPTATEIAVVPDDLVLPVRTSVGPLRVAVPDDGERDGHRPVELPPPRG